MVCLRQDTGEKVARQRCSCATSDRHHTSHIMVTDPKSKLADGMHCRKMMEWRSDTTRLSNMKLVFCNFRIGCGLADADCF